MSPLDRYTCDEALRRLDDYLDRELRPEEMRRVQHHIETCAVCAQEYAFEAKVIAEIRGKLHRIDVPASLRTRLAVLLETERMSIGSDGEWTSMS